MGYTVQDCAGGLTATAGTGGKCVLLRGAMDALKLTEDNGLPYRSTNGYAHMCGHDMHTAILLGAAALPRECALGGTVRHVCPVRTRTFHRANRTAIDHSTTVTYVYTMSV